MGASYSYHVNANSSNSPSIISDSLNSHKDIFVLFIDNNPLCYSFKFNSMFEKAVEMKNNVCYKLMTNYGNTFTVSTEEKTDNSSFYNVSILTRETNCLTSTVSILHTLSISKLKHLDAKVDFHLKEEDLSNELYNENNNEEENNEDNEEDNEEDETQGYNEHKEETEENEESVDKEPTKKE